MNKTLSIWSDLFRDNDKYKNLYYDSENIYIKLNPNYSFSALDFWDEYFCQNCRFIENKSFFLNQEEEVKKEEKQKTDMKMIKDFLYDIYLKSKDDEIFQSFDEDTKKQINFLGAREDEAKKQLDNKFANIFGTARK